MGCDNFDAEFISIYSPVYVQLYFQICLIVCFIYISISVISKQLYRTLKMTIFLFNPKPFSWMNITLDIDVLRISPNKLYLRKRCFNKVENFSDGRIENQ